MSWFAASSWLRTYAMATFRADLVAGISLATFVIPESIAYASLAGLPPVAGLYCYLIAGLAYAPFGSTRQIAVGPTSAIALLLASNLAPLSRHDAAHYAILASASAMFVGLYCLVARIIRVSFVVNFLGDVVLLGFKLGAALFIAATQVPKIFGLRNGGSNFFTTSYDILRHLEATHAPTLAIGGGSLLALLLLRRIFPGRPTTLVVVLAVLGLAASGWINMSGIQMTGPLPIGLPVPTLAFLGISPHELFLTAQIGLACFLLAYVETISAARTLANAHHSSVDANAELVALGVTNLSVATFGGFPVSGGMSQSAVNDLSGAKTPLALVVTSLSVGAVLLWFTGIFRELPEAVLGAIVVVAAIHIVDVRGLRALRRRSHHEFWIAIVAALAVLATGLLTGVLIATLFSLVMLLQRATQPEIAVLGEIPGTTTYVNYALNAHAIVRPDVLVVRTYGSWYYFNAEYIRTRLTQLIEERGAQLRLVVLDFSASPALDVQSTNVLASLIRALEERGIAIAFAHLYDETAIHLKRDGEHFQRLDAHRSIHDVVSQSLASSSQPSLLSETAPPAT
jgi:sulfate permease, SulP family